MSLLDLTIAIWVTAFLVIAGALVIGRELSIYRTSKNEPGSDSREEALPGSIKNGG